MVSSSADALAASAFYYSSASAEKRSHRHVGSGPDRLLQEHSSINRLLRPSENDGHEIIEERNNCRQEKEIKRYPICQARESQTKYLVKGQEVDSEISNQLIGLMVYLSIEDDTKDLYLFINSPSGWVIPGVAVYDTMQFVRPDVHTICMGLAASMASFILVGGEITKRLN
ncbi:uncharacterized protein LOC111385859 [Olea europaea var. sylvestris]|uniref:uncharacterized protein LOC111385859 n=1 Tax=Olea europaea var. sylvestris TaxID=158386 RepID=UPI000C1D64E2|nr:uncharacterized protein LOC111385859 [Olea europaea var. sylvestris]